MDDTLSSWSHGLDNLQKFLDHINSLHPSIKFTFEVQKDDKTILARKPSKINLLCMGLTTIV